MKLLSVIPLLGAVSAAAVAEVPIPKGNGPYNVQLATLKLTDHSRHETWIPCCKPRSIMISAFHPTHCRKTQLVPYLPPKTAAFQDKVYSEYGIPNGTFEAFRLQVCPSRPLPYGSTPEKFPVLVFSTGLGVSRLFYNSVAQWVASHGYSVVTIDHTYDAEIVEFPDGTVIPKGNMTDAITNLTDIPKDIYKALDVRSKDVIFVLDQLSRRSIARQLIPGSTRGLDVRRVGMFGHSLGGATAAEVMTMDKRIIGGLNLDGSFLGGVQNKTQPSPFVLFGASGHNRTTDYTWGQFWKHLKGFRRELSTKGTTHMSFSDFPLLLKALGLTEKDIPGESQLLGTIDGKRVMEIMTAYISGFFSFVLKGEGEGLLKGPSAKYPEVSFL